jgi:FlaA1/EpsC-like NDP-sugar epimerase
MPQAGLRLVPRSRWLRRTLRRKRFEWQLQAARRFMPRWAIFVFDAGLALGALGMAALLRFEFAIPPSEWRVLVAFLPLFLAVRLAAMGLFRTSAGVIRHAGAYDARRLLAATGVGTAIFAAGNLARAGWGDGAYFVPFSIAVIEGLLTASGLLASRFVVKWLYQASRRSPDEVVRVVIFGAGDAGLIAKRALEREPGAAGLQVVAFLDDDRRKAGKVLDGVQIIDATDAGDLFAEGGVDRLILAVQRLDPERRRQLVDLALAHGVRPLDVPPVDRWVGGELTARQIRELRIEDLLGRPPIQLDAAHAGSVLEGRRILVTGAAGSIGSELVRQICAHRPAAVCGLDQAETPLHDLMLEFSGQAGPGLDLRIADVRRPEDLTALCAAFRPDVVFHAAAYKHVPLMEAQPAEALRTNAWGTLNVLRAAQASGCATFVLVSTDKAVNPTNVMGATKRLAERCVHLQAARGTTRCVTTRFGNVLGSNGSVIPRFRAQIEAGGPVTVTHADVTRFFMTIPEAVALVLEAAALGRGDDLFVFDMGESVRIVDLARKMIQLAGREVDRDIKLEITGLRPGEKLHEELLAASEGLLPTHHPKILRAAHTASTEDETHLLDALDAWAAGGTGDADARDVLHRWVPEYTPTFAP